MKLSKLIKSILIPELVATGEFDEEEAFATLQQMLLEGVDFDAIFAGDDDSAIGAIRALKMAGRLVPDEVAVVGFDDVPFARYLSPPLTTVRAPTEEVGREAVRQLSNLMNGKPAQALTLMRTELVIREFVRMPRPVPQSFSGRFPHIPKEVKTQRIDFYRVDPNQFSNSGGENEKQPV